MRGVDHPGRSDQARLSLLTLPFSAVPNAAMPWVSIPMAVKGSVRISRSFAAFCCHAATICSHYYSVTRSLITFCSRLHRVMVCAGIQPSRAAIAAPIGGYRSDHLRPAVATRSGRARRAGAGAVCRGGGRPPINPDGGGVNICIGPSHIWDTQNGLFVKRNIDNTANVAVNHLLI